MQNILSKVNTPKDLKKLGIKEKEKLAKQIREEIIKTVSKTGGHLASNLGVVELTIALHSVFDTPKDKIIWDVGHQTYVHKMLTGRKEKMSTLRKLNGLAGFPKVCESEYDTFNTGHSSTSISIALGMARAREIKREKHEVIAVIGDGALTGGMALEALNDAGNSKTKLIVVLNDNEMSISKNVGGISRFLTRMRTKQFYAKSNNKIRKILEKVPKIGPVTIRAARRVKYSLKQLVIPNMFFEDLGFKYLGPVDGHDIERVEWVLNLAKKEQEGPILVHVITQKGKGYEPAEKEPDKYHSTSAFQIETGEAMHKKTKDYSKVMGEKLVQLARKNKKIVAVTAAMTDGTGLTQFKQEFPKRFFDAGIAEQHAIGLAAGLAKEGLIPVVPIYSSFYQRCYDQVIHDVCIQKLPVIMCVDRAGVVGNDGETHQGIFDMSFFNIVPNLTIMAPKDFQELEQMLTYAITLQRPVVIRYPRGGENTNISFTQHTPLKLGKAEKIIPYPTDIPKNTKKISIIAIGKMVAKAMELKTQFEKGAVVEVWNARFLKPMDEKSFVNSLKQADQVITIEDNIVKGALGSNIEELMVREHIQVDLKKIGYPDEFIPHGSVKELEDLYLFK